MGPGKQRLPRSIEQGISAWLFSYALGGRGPELKPPGSLPYNARAVGVGLSQALRGGRVGARLALEVSGRAG